MRHSLLAGGPGGNGGSRLKIRTSWGDDKGGIKKGKQLALLCEKVIKLFPMGIISWVFLGLVAGALAKFIMPGKDPGGIFVTIAIGIVGAILAGFLGSL